MGLNQTEPKAPVLAGDIAIIGMACLLPGAPDLDTYWLNIVSRVDAISDPPAEAWDADLFYDPDSTMNDRVYCKRGGYISPLTYFDPLANGVMPRAVEGGEPDQWLALQIARAALRDAGYGDEIPERERTAVILGKGTYLNRGNLAAVQHGRVIDQTLNILKTLQSAYGEAELETIRQALKKQLPPFNADTASGLIPNIIAGRIANRLNLMGPSYTVDGACASSLIALEIAVRNLLSEQCDMALVGGAHVVTPVPVLMLFCQLNALSRREQIRPFDKDADGTLLGEGIGIVVLKRLEDALRDGHRIYAVIKGVGVSSDGLGMSVMAPRLEGEILALQRAYDMAGVSPQSVGLMEAHGTGTPVGDVTEIKALSQIFGPLNGPYPWCALGSVKSMISHVMPAAGIAGLIKTSLALYHKILPPTLNVDQPNPELELEKTAFYLNTETRPWLHSNPDAPRRAGVNAFGFGGINAHVILEEAPLPEPAAVQNRHTRWESEVCILAAESRADLLTKIQQLQGFLQSQPDVQLKDVAYTLNVSLAGQSVRLAVVATNLEDLNYKLVQALEQLTDPQCRQIKDAQGIYFFEQPLGGQVAFLFPGEGSQYVNMLADLCLHFPEIREQFELIDHVFAKHARNYLPSDVIFPRPAFSEAERKQAEAQIWQMEGAIEAVLTANQALFDLLGRLEIRPDILLGHSTGEYSAMVAAGMIDLSTEDRVGQFSQELNQIYRQAMCEDHIAQTTLLAVAAPAETVIPLLEQLQGDIHIAMDNCPHQTVIVSPEDQTEALTTLLQEKGLIYQRLPFDRPYHTPLFKPYTERLRPFLAKWIATPPQIPVYSCTTAAPFTQDVAQNLAISVNHWLQTVDFRRTIAGLYDAGIRIFIEVGTSGNLTSFTNDILRAQPHLAVPANLKSRSGISQLNHLIGLLATQAVLMKLDYLYQYRSPRKVSFDRPDNPYGQAQASGSRMKLATGWPAIAISDEIAAQLQRSHPVECISTPPVSAPASANGAPSPTQPNTGQGGSRPALAPALPSSASSQIMSTHFQTMNQFLAVQEQVMQAYLNGQTAGLPTTLTGRQEAMSDAQITEPQEPKPASEVASPPSPIASNQPPSAAAENEVSPAKAPDTGGFKLETIRDLLLNLVSERTGYPVEMLDLDLDLEAQLGIDSIKRVEILGTLQQKTGLFQTDTDMETLSGCKTLQGVIDFLAELLVGDSTDQISASSTQIGSNQVEASGEAASSATLSGSLQPPWALIDRIVSLSPGQHLVAQTELSLARAPFLADHTLGRQISLTDPILRGLPLVPFTVSMEMLAEAAAVLMSGRYLVEMRDIRAYRWLALEEDAVSIELTATRKSSPNEVQVTIHEVQPHGETNGQYATPIIEGTMIFAETLPDSPNPNLFDLQEGRSSRWTPGTLYREGMFHGPMFQGVRDMKRVGTNGAEATLAINPAQKFVQGQTGSTFLTDPVLLDQPGQVVGFWTAECLETAYVIFPFYLEALYLYTTIPMAFRQADCQARIELVGQSQVRSDLDIIGPDGRVYARFIGWQDRRFDMPEPFYRFLLMPEDVVLSQPWMPHLVAGTDAVRLQGCRLNLDSFPSDFFTAHSGIWQRVLAHLILSRRERDQWRNLTLPPMRCLEWLLGRLAAKDATRMYLKQHHGLNLYPADIEIITNDDGRPQIVGPWTNQIPASPYLSITHSEGTVSALVSDGQSGMGLGIDVERLDRMNDAVEQMAFRPQERSLLAILPAEEKIEWLLRFWCAKEAATKALGQGLIDGPRALIVQSFDHTSGAVQVTMATQDGPSLTAATSREDKIITATCLAPLREIH